MAPVDEGQCWAGRRMRVLMDDGYDDEMKYVPALSWAVGYACGFMGLDRGAEKGLYLSMMGLASVQNKAWAALYFIMAIMFVSRLEVTLSRYRSCM